MGKIKLPAGAVLLEQDTPDISQGIKLPSGAVLIDDNNQPKPLPSLNEQMGGFAVQPNGTYQPQPVNHELPKANGDIATLPHVLNEQHPSVQKNKFHSAHPDIYKQAIEDFSFANKEDKQEVLNKLQKGDYVVDDGKVKVNGGFLDNLGQGAKDFINNIGLALNVEAAKANKNTDAEAENEIKYHLNEFQKSKRFDKEYAATDLKGQAGKIAGGLVPYVAAGALTGGYGDVPLMGLSNMAENHQAVWNDPKLTEDEKVKAINRMSNDAFMIGAAQGAAFHGVGEGAEKATANSLLSKYAPTSDLKYKFTQSLYNNFNSLLHDLPKGTAKTGGIFAGTQAANEVNKATQGVKVDFSKVPEAFVEGAAFHLLTAAPKVLASAMGTLRNAVKSGEDKTDPSWFNSYSKQTQDALNNIVKAPEPLYQEMLSQLDGSQSKGVAATKSKIETFRGYYNELPAELPEAAKDKALHILQLKTEAVHDGDNTKAEAYDGLFQKVISGGKVDDKEPLLIDRLPNVAVVRPEEMNKPEATTIAPQENIPTEQSKGAAVILPETRQEPNVVELNKEVVNSGKSIANEQDNPVIAETNKSTMNSPTTIGVVDSENAKVPKYTDNEVEDFSKQVKLKTSADGKSGYFNINSDKQIRVTKNGKTGAGKGYHVTLHSANEEGAGYNRAYEQNVFVTSMADARKEAAKMYFNEIRKDVSDNVEIASDKPDLSKGSTEDLKKRHEATNDFAEMEAITNELNSRKTNPTLINETAPTQESNTQTEANKQSEVAGDIREDSSETKAGEKAVSDYDTYKKEFTPKKFKEYLNEAGKGRADEGGVQDGRVATTAYGNRKRAYGDYLYKQDKGQFDDLYRRFTESDNKELHIGDYGNLKELYAAQKKPNSEQPVERSVATAETTEKPKPATKNEPSNIPATASVDNHIQEEVSPSKVESDKGAVQGSPDKVGHGKPKAADAVGVKPTTKVSSGLRAAAKKLREGELPSFLKTDLPDGTQKQGFGGKDLQEAVAKGLEAVADLIDSGAELAKAIEEGFEHIRQHYKDNKAKFKDEEAVKKQFTEFVKDNIGDGGEPPKEETTTGNSDEEWAAIRQEKLKEIDKVRRVFEKEGTITWSEIQQQALENVAREYPDKDLYGAVKAKTEAIAAKYDNKVDYNPTAKDLAVIQEFKRQTEKRIEQSKDRINSDDDIVRKAAMLEVEGYDTDLENIGKASFKREAGTAFGYRQSESKMDADYGLQIRRMQLMRAQGGEKLSDEQMKWTKDMWDKEKDIFKREQEKRENDLKAAFEKQVTDLKNDYEAKLKQATKDKPASSKEKTLSQKGKDVADLIRKLKTDKGSLKVDFTIGGWNLAVEGIAQLVEKGATIAEAIDELIKDKKIQFKTDKDRGGFEKNLVDFLDNTAKRDDALENIKKLAEENKDTDLTNDMVAKGYVRDFVNSHLGEFEAKDILSEATKALQKVLPDVTQKRLIEAFLQQGDFKQPTKADLEGSLATAKKELRSAANILQDIEDLEGLKVMKEQKEPAKLTAYQKELLEKKNALLKEYNDRRRQIIEENRKLESAKIKEDNEIQKRKDELAEIDANIERAKKGMEHIKTFKNKSPKVIDDELEAKRRELIKVTRENLPDDKQQAQKLEAVKKKLRSDIKELTRKLKDKEFEDKPTVTLRKIDAETIKLQKEKRNIEDLYNKERRTVAEKNKGALERLTDFVRGAFVNTLIMGSKTMAKITWMSVIRPISESVTKLTAGKAFDTMYPSLSKAAMRGGEGSSLSQVAKGWGLYLRQMGAKEMQAKYEKSNAAYEQAAKKYKDYKDNGGSDKAELSRLENDMKNKAIAAMGDEAYRFVGGSSIQDALRALIHRANIIEGNFGHVDIESIKDGDWLDKTNYIISFIGRSHSALKTFSGRFSFGAAFMARVEASIRNGETLDSDKMIEIGHESYFDFERGKYQQSNYISDKWNQVITNLDRKMSNPKWDKYNKVAVAVLRANVPITRVPINVLHEAVMEYTLGAFRAVSMAKKAYAEANKQAYSEGFSKLDADELRDRVRQIVSGMDEKQAATIARAFRKGTMGMGLYALALMSGLVHFGVFPHLGQPKKKDEDKLGKDELNPGQIQIGDTKLGELTSAMIEHTPALWPTFMGLGIAKIYKDDIDKGNTTAKAVADAVYTHLKIIEGGIPQMKIFGITTWQEQMVKTEKKRLDDWGLFSDSKTGIEWDNEEGQKFLIDNKLKVPALNQGTIRTAKDEKHPDGKLHNQEFAEVKKFRDEKIQQALTKAIKHGLISSDKNTEQNQEEVKWMSEQSLEWAKEKVLGKKKESIKEQISKARENSKRSIFKIGLFN